MYFGTAKLYQYQIAYCLLAVALEECPWWKFWKKNEIKQGMDSIYALMRMELVNLGVIER